MQEEAEMKDHEMTQGHRCSVLLANVLPIAFALTTPAFGLDLPQLDAIQAQTRALEDVLVKQAKANTERFLEQARERERRECEGLYRRIPEGQYLVPADIAPAFQALSRDLNAVIGYIKPLADLNQEVARRKSELAGLTELIARAEARFRADDANYRQQINDLRMMIQGDQHTLAGLRRDEAEAVVDWLTKHGTKDSRPVTVRSADHVIVISPVRLGGLLFGTFIARHAPEVDPKQQARIAVIFTPTILSDELAAGSAISLTPARYSIEVAPTVRTSLVEFDARAEPFQLGRPVPASFKNPITWTWTLEAPDNFNGIAFDILYEGRLRAVGTSEKSGIVAKLPIDIRRRDKPSASLGQILGPYLGGTIAVVVTNLITGFGAYKAGRGKKKSPIVGPTGGPLDG